MSRTFRRFAAVTVCLLLIVGVFGTAAAKSKKKKKTPTPSPTVSEFPRDAWSNEDDVFLLDDMSEDAEKLLPIPYGEKVVIVEQDQDERGLTWCLIEYEEEIGFVSREDLSDQEIVPVTPSPAPTKTPEPDRVTVTEDGQYSDKEHVAEYLRQFRHLPAQPRSEKPAHCRKPIKRAPSCPPQRLPPYEGPQKKRPCPTIILPAGKHWIRQ